MISEDLIEFLKFKSAYYETEKFIEDDPVQIPRSFELLQDIEISGLITALISWGNRKSIIKSGDKLIDIFRYEPYNFVMNFKNSPSERKRINSFVHRTFNGEDLLFFIKAFQKVYSQHSSLEEIFTGSNTFERIHSFFLYFMSANPTKKSIKHLPNVEKGSAAKRVNMFLRWMVRKGPVDIGCWKSLSPAELLIPLDVHTGNTSRALGLLQRKQNDKKAVEELTGILKKIDPIDPVRFDFALFGIGVYEQWSKNLNAECC